MTYDFKPYNQIFPKLFTDEKKLINNFLGESYGIEHVGSTAVPDLGGKGVIDICIIDGFNDFEKVSNGLLKAGYSLRPDFKPGMHVTHIKYLSDKVEENRKYQIHIHQPDSTWLKEALAFRDYLRNHPEDARKYEDIKREAAKLAENNKEKYISFKQSIIEEIKKKAKQEYGL